MVAYGQDIPQIMVWTMPQLRLLARYRDIRERNERRWQLALASGTMSEEAAETLWEQLSDDEGGEYSGVVSSDATGGTGSGHRSRPVDAKGNVVARGAPLLSDIALGKAVAPDLIPITFIDKSKQKDEDA
jgi:hypothetical protein